MYLPNHLRTLDERFKQLNEMIGSLYERIAEHGTTVDGSIASMLYVLNITLQQMHRELVTDTAPTKKTEPVEYAYLGSVIEVPVSNRMILQWLAGMNLVLDRPMCLVFKNDLPTLQEKVEQAADHDPWDNGKNGATPMAGRITQGDRVVADHASTRPHTTDENLPSGF